MKIENIDPELRKVFRCIPPIPFHVRYMLPIIRMGIRFGRRAKIPHGVNVTTHKLGNVGLRIYKPSNWESGPALLWIHGGGLITGQPEISDGDCCRYASELNILVVSVKYRLAPEHPYPAAIDDCFSAWQWLSDSTANNLGVDTSRIIVGGESAGGGLAASLCQRILDTSSDIQPAAQFLCCPMLDDRTAAKRELDVTKHRVWNNKNNRFGWSAYLGSEAGSVTVPEYSVPARRENLTGLPPTWIGVGDVDLFYEENREYAERLNAAGVQCELYTATGGPHGFHLFVPNSSSALEFYRLSMNFLSTHTKSQNNT